ncbi:hypothetical protein CK203_047180 [Vitis vinifera]|uniref:Uncharacterized protein n=1 Tax=Vitis vinifera TaxID=29760 RepID=A0A438GST2_VITVI|nr:hypothetical protein CK203_047180 [Vitis vinifera]
MGGDLPSLLSFRPAGGRTWRWQAVGDDLASLARYGSPDRGACHVSSWGVRMELLRIAMRAMCYQGEGFRVSASDIGVVRVTALRTSSLLCQFALGFLLPPAPFAGYRSCFGVEPRLGWGCWLCSISVPLLKMPAKKDVVLSSAAGQSGKDASGVVYGEKSVDKLNVRQFYERFCIPNGVFVQLVDGEAVSIEKSTDNAIYFTNEQFNAGAPTDLFNLGRLYAFPSTGDPSSGFNKRGAKGHVLVRGIWAGYWSIWRDRSPQTVRRYGQEGSRSRIGSAWGHFALKDLPFYERARKADAKARQECLDQREEKRQEGTLRKAPGEKDITLSQRLVPRPRRKEEEEEDEEDTFVESEEAEEPEATSSSLQLVVFHSGPSSPSLSRSLLVYKLRTTRGDEEPNSLGSGGEDPAPKVPVPATTRPDGNRASASAPVPPDAAGPSTATMVQADGPGHSSLAMVGTPMPEGVAEVPTSEKAPVERDNAEARHPLGISESVVPLILHLQEWTMSEAVEVVTFGIRYMMRSCEQLFKRLKVAEAMRALYLPASGMAMPGGGEREAIRAEADSLRKEKEALEGQVNEVGQENLQLKREMEELRANLAAQKKELEDLRAGMVAQKEEMEASFAA